MPSCKVRVGEEDYAFVFVDIIHVLESYGIKGDVRGAEFVARCPFHDDRSPSWSIRLIGENAGRWQCFSPRCAKRGDIASLIAIMEGCGRSAALKSLLVADLPNEPKDAQALASIAKKLALLGVDHDEQTQIRWPLPRSLSKGFVETYFTAPKTDGGRGYSKEDFVRLKTDDIMYCEAGYYKNSIIIPIFDDQGEQLAFVSRSLSERVLEKYRYPKGWEKALCTSALIAEDTDCPVICEGMFDGMHIQGIWGKNAEVVFGSTLSYVQIAKLAKKYKKVYLGLDGDDAGRSGTYKAIPTFQAFGTEVEVLELPEGLDPPMIPTFAELQAKNAVEFMQEWDATRMLKKFSQLGNPK